ncbi:hypothetical protein [Methanosarcina siciliae]|uniref:hypothetical protein n=1 Tax=Methanosarcina siciliae TaxID=38027 RepID=UPI00064F3F0A|nr:hypothetical protein [Methanosarcina siciliae]
MAKDVLNHKSLDPYSQGIYDKIMFGAKTSKINSPWFDLLENIICGVLGFYIAVKIWYFAFGCYPW